MSRTRGQRLRAIVDANLLISAVLSPDPARSAPSAILREARIRTFDLVVSAQTLDEVLRVASEMPWITSRVSEAMLRGFFDELNQIAEIAPSLSSSLPRVSRDPGDDYLLAESVRSEVDVLVTRDRDLLDLGAVAGVSVLDPAAFLALLRASSKS